MNKKQRMYEAIEKHGENLNKLFKTDLDNITLSKKLFSLEAKAHRMSTDYCNGDISSFEEWETLTDALLIKVDKITDYKSKNIPIFVNGDARGYALKIEDSYIRENKTVIYRDWGGYGILAPDFREAV